MKYLHSSEGVLPPHPPARSTPGTGSRRQHSHDPKPASCSLPRGRWRNRQPVPPAP